MNATTHFPSPEDLLHYFERNHGRGSRAEPLLSSLALFGTGLLVGAGLALLFAPSSGEELRHEIGERVGDLQEHVAADGGSGDSSSA